MGRSPAVVFDYSGSLTLARMSWRLADELETLIGERRADAGAALVEWAGAFAEQFGGRIDDETRAAAALAEQMRLEAGGWAEEWRKAMDQENWNRYQAACDRVRDGRGLVDDVVGFFAGHDDLPPEPRPAAVPAAPHFAPTRSFADYSSY